MISVENLTYQYPQGNTRVLSAFSAQFRRGEIVAVSGRNGCGKTTLTKLIAGVLKPSKGCVYLDGLDVSDMDLFTLGRRIGYVFQNPNRQLFCDTVYNEVAYGLRNLELDDKEVKEKASHYLEYFGLQRYRDIYPGKLSIGEKQRLALAAVLALGTDHLVLDEPTTGLDVLRRRELGDLLLKLRQELNCGIVFVSHETGFITRCADREVVMLR